MSGWTDEKVKVLRLMYSKGHRAREIAKIIGCTTNAVIGKANRMGIKHPHPSGKGRT